MNGSAGVHSLEALLAWHASLCIFRTDASEAMASVALEIQRADSWFEDRLRHWQNAARDAEEEVARAKAELSNRRFPDFSGRIPDCSVQEEALWKAESRLEYTRDQIEVVRRWCQRLPRMIGEAYEGPARHLINFLEGDLQRGTALLKNQIASLDAYLNLQSERVPAAPAPPAGKDAP